MITDVVKQVCGTHVEVTGLMKPGVDPHLYKASQGDIQKLDKADVIFYSGLHLEGKMADILEMSKIPLSITNMSVAYQKKNQYCAILPLKLLKES